MQQLALRNNKAVAESLASIMSSIAVHHDAVVAHQAQFAASMRAASANRVARTINRGVLESSGRNVKTDGGGGGGGASARERLCPLVKEFFAAGDFTPGGIALANSLVPGPELAEWQAWPPLATPELGSALDNFPRAPEDVDALSHADLLRLIAFYNESFAMQRDDPVELRREKFRIWIST